MAELAHVQVERVVRATPKALLVQVDEVEAWIPRELIHDDSEVFDAGENSTGTLVIPLWLAEEKGIA